ncbi:lipoprotein, tandem type [Leptospira noguchii]|uniref:Lipoprotein, tandem type n=1 Tax=Leptospira noguchii str. 2001034031 TaxID=1193053 RepID=M6Y0T3_9LEPT|nr:lipoprotein, tandem type [Leptospira noguchii]EMO87932.1 hypothetical protein LEP1GSC024_0313 [Leptospira noguchii str. 2001034031]
MKKYLILSMIIAIGLNGCKKSKEELEKEEEVQKLKLVIENVNSVYQLGSNGLAFFVDLENAKTLRGACFNFRPKEGKASVKFYKHPEVYNLEVKAKNELEYILTYQGKQATLKLILEGDYPVKEGSMQKLFANPILTVPGDDKANGSIGKMDLVYGGNSIRNLHHGRFNTLEECEAQNVKDDELNESLRKQESTCEGPGC